MYGEGRCFLTDDFLKLSLPAKAGRKVVFIQPYAKACGARIRAIQEPAFERPRRVSVGP
jgi:hypothetical protein